MQQQNQQQEQQQRLEAVRMDSVLRELERARGEATTLISLFVHKAAQLPRASQQVRRLAGARWPLVRSMQTQARTAHCERSWPSVAVGICDLRSA